MPSRILKVHDQAVIRLRPRLGEPGNWLQVRAEVHEQVVVERERLESGRPARSGTDSSNRGPASSRRGSTSPAAVAGTAAGRMSEAVRPAAASTRIRRARQGRSHRIAPPGDPSTPGRGVVSPGTGSVEWAVPWHRARWRATSGSRCAPRGARADLTPSRSMADRHRAGSGDRCGSGRGRRPTASGPSSASSTRIRPITDANLKPWAAPRPTTTPGASGSRSTTKSRSGVRCRGRSSCRCPVRRAPGRWSLRNRVTRA